MGELSTNRVEEEEIPLEKVSKQVEAELSFVKLIDVELVAFPDNAPWRLFALNTDADNVPVFGLYVNGVVALSTNSVEVEDKVLLNGIKYVPDVLSLVNAIDDEEVELPLKLPENVVAVIVPFIVVVELLSNPKMASVTAFWLFIVLTDFIYITIWDFKILCLDFVETRL